MKNWKFVKVGNSDKEFKSEQELRRWAIDHQYTYKPTHGGYYMLEDDSGKGREPIEAHVSQTVVNKTGNAQYGSKEDIKSHLETDLYDVYQKINDKNAPSFEYVRQLQKKGWDISTIAKYNGFVGQVLEKLKAGNRSVCNISADITTDGNTWFVTTSDGNKKEFTSEREAEEYVKKINAGNKKIGNKYEWTTRNGELQYFDYSVPFGGHKKGSVEKTSGGYTGYKTNGSIIISKKEFQTEEEAKKYVENKKVGNESIDKQEWSMFKGLSKDAEKEVGNAYTPNPELIKVLEAWLHNRMSEQEARAKIMKITGDKNITDMMIHSPGGFIPAGNKKTGNESIGDEYNAEIYRLEKKKMDLERMGQGQKAREIEKQIQQLQKELREYDIGNKKVGNARPKEQLLADVRELTKYIQEHNGQGCEKEKRLLGEAKEELDKNYGIIVGNSKTGNTGHWDSKKMIYSKWDDEKGRPSDEYARITWLGEGKGGLAVVWRGTSMTGVKYGSNDLEDLRRWAEEKIGNETLAEYAKSKPRVINGLCRARNAMTKNAMSIADLEAQIKKNEEYIKSLQGKTVDSEGWSAKASIQEAQDEIDRMKSRIEELKKQGNKKG